ncbi:hypothetical protein EJ02DRAFT_445405 [Clathrospora elynae]|uniref:Mitochondrial fission 1 protein n=1 Tax=Clathrospora elynae TaxID=706981 RepID=A0A6A5SLM1_9PLEO|nr:hypothetical protein EJ02DRAFT_445405 [Clathrospora elynae]
MSPSLPCEWDEDFWGAGESSFQLDAADVESPLKPEELQVLRAQYEKEGEYVGLQTKFNYAWGLIKSNSRPDQQEGVRLLSEIFRNSRERRRECLYYLALGNYKLGNYAEARRYNELLLELEPANLQAGSLKGLIDEKVAKEGLHQSYYTHTHTHKLATMDQSSTQDAPPQSQQAAAHRDMMFCHECSDEWYRDQHGLTCPECGSDFTEIIEDNNDPRARAFGHDGDDSDSLPELEESAGHLHPAHNPWQSDDPDEADISNLHFTQTAPGRFNIRGTATRTVSPQELQGGLGAASMGGFMSLLSGLAGAAASPNTQARASRFTYSTGTPAFPRDANSAEARVEPVDGMNVMAGLMAAWGAPPGHVVAHYHTDGTLHGEQNPGTEAQLPILQFFSSLGFMGPGGANLGDFAHSQEALDRIVSQLMEQTATSNAPGPATRADIDSLARKNVTEEMLGEEHKAECSICMDEVNIGEEVTALPCNHWFHHQCVSAWLLEHDTCPHCRKGITKRAEGESNSAGSPGAQADRTSQMPGSFSPSGSGSINDPYVVPPGTPAPPGPARSQTDSTDTASSSAAQGGISDRIRRGLFGAPQSQ